MNSISLRILTVPAMAVLSMALSACGEGTYNGGVESVHQPVIQRTDYTIDVALGGVGGLADGERARLESWFDALRIGYGDRVSIDDPSSYGSGDAARTIAALAGRHGLMLADQTPVTVGEIRPGSLRVVVSRTKASVPGCPDWSRPSQPEFAASTTSNYGCASATNLAAMVANPEDLVHGQAGHGAIDTKTATKAVNSFRDRVPSGFNEVKAEATSKGSN